MDKVEGLPDITRLSDNVVRVLGQNPGKFTLQGTNTYLVGTQNPYTLIDTGEGLSTYIPILASALAGPTDPTQPDVGDIVLSHWHHDHVGGLLDVLGLLRRLWVERALKSSSAYTPPRIHKFPTPPTHNEPRDVLPNILASLPPNTYTPSPSGSALHDLRDLQTLPHGLQVLHTPGHTSDSICLYLPADRALYTADTVLGHGTAVFEDLGIYMGSLKRMLGWEGEYGVLYPAHGGVLKEGREVVRGYIGHRMEREEEVVRVLGGRVEGGEDWTTWEMVKRIYKKYPESLWMPAARGIDLHLKKLEGEGKVRRLGGEGTDTKWKLVNSPSPAL